MSVYFTRLVVGYPRPMTHPVDWEGCWKVYETCEEASLTSRMTLRDVRALNNPSDIQNARRTFVTLLEKAHTGEPLANLYDEKQCHEIHEFTYSRPEGQPHRIKIWRIWGAGDIRVCFMYLPNRRIVLLKTFAKRSQKLDSGQKIELEGLAIAVLKTVETRRFEECVI